LPVDYLPVNDLTAECTENTGRMSLDAQEQGTAKQTGKGLLRMLSPSNNDVQIVQWYVQS
jgi:hypothetical protein